jgi:hypothetical protein
VILDEVDGTEKFPDFLDIFGWKNFEDCFNKFACWLVAGLFEKESEEFYFFGA